LIDPVVYMTAKEAKRLDRSFGVLFSSVFYVLAGIYIVIFPILFERFLFPLYFIAGACVIAGVGIFLMWRWAFWLAVVAVPAVVTAFGSVLFYSIVNFGFNPDWSTGLFNVINALCLVFTAIALLFLLDKRKEFK